MAEKELVLKEKLEHSGLMDFPGLYSFLHSWLKDEGYGVTEERYAEKVSGAARDLLIEWKAGKMLSDYFKMEHKIKFEAQGLTEVEVEIDGKRKKMNKGKLVFELTGGLIKDPDSKWEATPANRFMRDVYNKYVIPARVEAMRDKVRADIRNLKEMTKEFLDLYAKR